MTADPKRAEPPERQVSKKLFGSQYRLEIAAAITRLDAPWTIVALEDGLKKHRAVPSSCVAKEIKTLLELDLVQRSDDVSADGRHQYRRRDYPIEFWRLIDALSGIYGIAADQL